MEAVLHPLTKSQITSFVQSPKHALLLSGPLGAGKLTLALNVASGLLGTMPNKLVQQPYYLELSGNEDNITIEAIRALKNFMQLKTTGENAVRRIAIIENAERMTTEAQNALLKVLEEPPEDSVLILTTTNKQALLPTIISRMQHIAVRKPAENDVLQAFEDLDQTEVKRAYYMSDGQIGLMTTILRADESHPILEYIDIAKTLLKQSPYERLLQVNELASKDLYSLCEAIYSVAHAALIVAIEKNQAKLIKHWYGVCQTVNNTETQLKYKPQSKLLLTHMLINL